MNKLEICFHLLKGRAKNASSHATGFPLAENRKNFGSDTADYWDVIQIVPRSHKRFILCYVKFSKPSDETNPSFVASLEGSQVTGPFRAYPIFSFI